MPYEIVDIRSDLPRNPAGYPLRKPEGVVAFMPHHYAGWGGSPGDAALIHLGKWKTAGGIAYDYFIPEEENDVIYLCHSIEEKGYHCGGGGMNSKALSCCLAGNFEERAPEPWQIYKLVWLIIHTNDRDGLLRLIVWHRDHTATLCPGKYFPTEEVISRVADHYEEPPEPEPDPEPTPEPIPEEPDEETKPPKDPGGSGCATFILAVTGLLYLLL